MLVSLHAALLFCLPAQDLSQCPLFLCLYTRCYCSVFLPRISRNVHCFCVFTRGVIVLSSCTGSLAMSTVSASLHAALLFCLPAQDLFAMSTVSASLRAALLFCLPAQDLFAMSTVSASLHAALLFCLPAQDLFAMSTVSASLHAALLFCLPAQDLSQCPLFLCLYTRCYCSVFLPRISRNVNACFCVFTRGVIVLSSCPGSLAMSPVSASLHAALLFCLPAQDLFAMSTVSASLHAALLFCLPAQDLFAMSTVSASLHAALLFCLPAQDLFAMSTVSVSLHAALWFCLPAQDLSQCQLFLCIYTRRYCSVFLPRISHNVNCFCVFTRGVIVLSSCPGSLAMSTVSVSLHAVLLFCLPAQDLSQCPLFLCLYTRCYCSVFLPRISRNVNCFCVFTRGVIVLSSCAGSLRNVNCFCVFTRGVIVLSSCAGSLRNVNCFCVFTRGVIVLSSCPGSLRNVNCFCVFTRGAMVLSSCPGSLAMSTVSVSLHAGVIVLSSCPGSVAMSTVSVYLHAALLFCLPAQDLSQCQLFLCLYTRRYCSVFLPRISRNVNCFCVFTRGVIVLSSCPGSLVMSTVSVSLHAALLFCLPAQDLFAMSTVSVSLRAALWFCLPAQDLSQCQLVLCIYTRRYCSVFLPRISRNVNCFCVFTRGVIVLSSCPGSLAMSTVSVSLHAALLFCLPAHDLSQCQLFLCLYTRRYCSVFLPRISRNVNCFCVFTRGVIVLSSCPGSLAMSTVSVSLHAVLLFCLPAQDLFAMSTVSVSLHAGVIVLSSCPGSLAMSTVSVSLHAVLFFCLPAQDLSQCQLFLCLYTRRYCSVFLPRISRNVNCFCVFTRGVIVLSSCPGSLAMSTVSASLHAALLFCLPAQDLSQCQLFLCLYTRCYCSVFLPRISRNVNCFCIFTRGVIVLSSCPGSLAMSTVSVSLHAALLFCLPSCPGSLAMSTVSASLHAALLFCLPAQDLSQCQLFLCLYTRCYCSVVLPRIPRNVNCFYIVLWTIWFQPCLHHSGDLCFILLTKAKFNILIPVLYCCRGKETKEPGE